MSDNSITTTTSSTTSDATLPTAIIDQAVDRIRRNTLSMDGRRRATIVADPRRKSCIKEQSAPPLIELASGLIPSSRASLANTTEGQPTFNWRQFLKMSSRRKLRYCKHRLFVSSYNLWQNFKLMIPHFLLVVALLSYTMFGAYILQTVEEKADIELNRKQFVEISLLYSQIINNTWRQLNNATISKQDWNEFIQVQLKNLTMQYDSSMFDFEHFTGEREIRSRWTFQSAVLYALTLLTTCGYDQVAPLTDGGKIFAIAFALIGIPLMFITAADIGKFLSEMTRRFWKRVKPSFSYLYFRIKHCTAHSVPLIQNIDVQFDSSPKGNNNNNDDNNRKLEEAAGLPPGTLNEATTEMNAKGSDSLWFPIGAYIILMCAYCALGGWLYTSWEEGWDFIHAFHFSFNLITTVGLSGIVVEDETYLVLIMIYVIIGLAIVTMCVDLASTQLKAYFTKIHYFGRARSRFLGMSEDIREMLAIITAMRKRKPGAKIDWNDIRQFLQLEQQLYLRPYVPRHVHLWRFIDETSSVLSTMRQNSFQSDMLCSSISSLHRNSRSSAFSSRNGRSLRPDNLFFANERAVRALSVGSPIDYAGRSYRLSTTARRDKNHNKDGLLMPPVWRHQKR